MKKFFCVLCLLFVADAFSGTQFLLKTKTNPNFLQQGIRRKMTGIGGSEGDPKFVVKMNFTQLLFRNLSFQAEYAFHPKLSVALGFSYLMRRKLPAVIFSGNEYFSRPTYGGFAVTPELRFYPMGDEEEMAPNGFYLAPYLRYANYSLRQTVTWNDKFTDPANPKKYVVDAKHTYAGINGGLMLGYQWIINERMAFDLWIIGFGFGSAKYTYMWEVPSLQMTPQQQEDVKKYATEAYDELAIIAINSAIETTPNSASLSVGGLPMYSFRFLGFNFGFAF